MKAILLMMLTAVCYSATSAQWVPRPFIPPPPGPLETFLDSNPNATVVKKQTGILVGSNQEKAVFIAVVASSPADPTVKFKGIEIQITDTGHTRTLYLDYEPAVRPDSRDNFQHFLIRLAFCEDTNAITVQVHEQNPAATRYGANTDAFAHNRVAFDIGWWHTEEDTGVMIIGPRGRHFVYLPGTSISQAMESIKAAREFLIAN